MRLFVNMKVQWPVGGTKKKLKSDGTVPVVHLSSLLAYNSSGLQNIPHSAIHTLS